MRRKRQRADCLASSVAYHQFNLPEGDGTNGQVRFLLARGYVRGLRRIADKTACRLRGQLYACIVKRHGMASLLAASNSPWKIPYAQHLTADSRCFYLFKRFIYFGYQVYNKSVLAL